MLKFCFTNTFLFFKLNKSIYGLQIHLYILNANTSMYQIKIHQKNNTKNTLNVQYNSR